MVSPNVAVACPCRRRCIGVSAVELERENRRVELAEVAAELYGIAPDEFLERRKELVVAARARKDRDAVKAIGALRRPTVAAWLVNLLTRDEGGVALHELAGLGVQLREAQAQLAADRLRELARERRSRVADLVSRAVELAEAAGHVVTPAVEREVGETLVAAVADQDAAEAVLSGSLTRALSYSGFGQVDVDLAVAMRPSRAEAEADTDADTEAATAADERAQAEAEAAQAEQQAEAEAEAARAEERALAEAALAEAQAHLSSCEVERSNAAVNLEAALAAASEAADRVADLEQQVDAARAVVDRLGTAFAELVN